MSQLLHRCGRPVAAEIAAYVLSCIALPISLVSLWFVWRRDRRDNERRSDEKQKHPFALEQRYEDRTPELRGGIDGKHPTHAWQYLGIQLERGEPLTRLRLELPEGAGSGSAAASTTKAGSSCWRGTGTAGTSWRWASAPSGSAV